MPLPPPPDFGTKPNLPQPRRKSGIRTASATVGEQFVERMRQLKEDPARVVPEVVGDRLAYVDGVRRRLERLRGGKAGLLARFDRGIVGAVARSIPLADQAPPTRLVDAKVAGQRRFYLIRGHVHRPALLGVQNHDEPRALLLAWAEAAKKKGFHLFAGDALWASAKPQPPEGWLAYLQERGGITLAPADGGWSCPHPTDGQVCLRLRGGPQLRCCAACGAKAEGFHRMLRSSYAGPNQRQPFEVALRMPDGKTVEPERTAVARYRAGLDGEAELLRPEVARWQQTAGHAYLVGGKVHPSQEAFLDAVAMEPWEREVVRRLTEGGYTGPAGVAAILEANRARLGKALGALVPDGETFLAQRPGMALRDVVRAAHQESVRRQATAVLPEVRCSGPVGELADRVARLNRGDGRNAALAPIRKAFEERRIGRSHLFALVQALGGDLSLDARFSPDDRHGGAELLESAKAVVATDGAAYVEALQRFLAEGGSGETADPLPTASP